jgi:hypothetical protein
MNEDERESGGGALVVVEFELMESKLTVRMCGSR